MKEFITSSQNPKVKEILKLRKASNREEAGLIVVEGHQEIGMALTSGLELDRLYYCGEYNHKDRKIAGLEEELIISVVPAVFLKISYRENPDGFLAIFKASAPELSKIKLSANPLVIILESLEKPGNLGAIFRSADAAGVNAVIINDKKTDIYNANVIRASLGTIFTTPHAVSTLEETRAWLEKNKIKTFAAAPAATKLYTEVNYDGPVAIVVGEEHPGLSESWLEQASEKVRIPMSGKIDSLNVSVSTAVILFEAIRQRK